MKLITSCFLKFFFTWLLGHHIPLVFLQIHCLGLPLLLHLLVSCTPESSSWICSLFTWTMLIPYIVLSTRVVLNCSLSLITPKCTFSVCLSLWTLDSIVYFTAQLRETTGISHLIYPKPHSCRLPQPTLLVIVLISFNYNSIFQLLRLKLLYNPWLISFCHTSYLTWQQNLLTPT